MIKIEKGLQLQDLQGNIHNVYEVSDNIAYVEVSNHLDYQTMLDENSYFVDPYLISDLFILETK